MKLKDLNTIGALFVEKYIHDLITKRESPMDRPEDVKYDKRSIKIHDSFKESFVGLDFLIQSSLMSGTNKYIIMSKLEEAFVLVCKVIREDQISRNK